MDTQSSSLTEQLQCLCLPIPPALGKELAPALGCVYEWRDYCLECPTADNLRVGTERRAPIRPGLFNLRFENQLGLTAIQPFAAGRPLTPPCYVEVISPKFPSPAAHLRFYRTLLDDLFTQAARLPFTFGGPTARGVLETSRPPTPLFALHFLCHFAGDLAAALSIVQGYPHRTLRDAPDLVLLHEATEADADVLLEIAHAPERWAPAPGAFLAGRLGGHAPGRVWQRLPEQTTDTPENRFVRNFVQQLLASAEALPAQRWWPNVPQQRQARVRETAALLQQALCQPPLADLGRLHHLPLNSQVLLRRDGYRALLDLWQRFQLARRPLFAPLQQALELRDIATLYEFWVFFRLVTAIQEAFDVEAVLHLSASDEHGLAWGAEAHFGSLGRLLYNRSYGWRSRSYHSYSLPLRPDFTWVRAGRPVAVLDAKFRLEWLSFEKEEDNLEASAGSVAKREDIYKMHAYRDALNLQAAVAVYPGDQAVFYDEQHGRSDVLELDALLNGNLSGVGALPLRPAPPDPTRR